VALLAVACGPSPEEGVAASLPAPSPVPASAIPLAAEDISWVVRRARLAAASELVAITGSLPPGTRDAEAAWLLRHGDARSKAVLIAALDIPEVVRLRRLLRAAATSQDTTERDRALCALARAGEVDVQPLVARALRFEASEPSLTALARAAADLGAVRPTAAIAEALARARSPEALAALARALGNAVDAATLAAVASRGRAGAEALRIAVGALRTPALVASWDSMGLTAEACRVLLDAADDPVHAGELGRLADRGLTRFELERMLGGEVVLERAAVPVAEPARCPELPAAAVATLRCRAVELLERDAHLVAAATGVLAARLRLGERDVASAAFALGAIGGREAVVVLGRAVLDAPSPAPAEVSEALTHALGVGPPAIPKDASATDRWWFPVIATLVPEALHGGRGK
jgi:hypothetical protein